MQMAIPQEVVIDLWVCQGMGISENWLWYSSRAENYWLSGEKANFHLYNWIPICLLNIVKSLPSCIPNFSQAGFFMFLSYDLLSLMSAVYSCLFFHLECPLPPSLLSESNPFFRVSIYGVIPLLWNCRNGNFNVALI